MNTASPSRWALAAALVLIPAAATADDPRPSPYEPCSRILDNAARLQCFDATFAREASLAVQRQEEQRVEAVENFGFSGAQIQERAREAREAQVAAGEQPAPLTPMSEGEAIQTTVREVLLDQRNNYVLMLENGQIWRATAAKNYRGSIRPGWKVQIKEGAFSGYRLTIEGTTGSLGVERVR